MKSENQEGRRRDRAATRDRGTPAARPWAATVDLVVLNDAPPLLAREVVQRGERILCANPEADHAFVRDVQLRAADLAPFLERARRVKLSRLTG
jgi:hypothetical protein